MKSPFGRIVHYRLKPNEGASELHQYAPAICVFVCDGEGEEIATLTVFHPIGGGCFRAFAKEGVEPGDWKWPVDSE